MGLSHNTEDHIGRRFGFLVVLSTSPRTDRKAYVYTRCDCGTIKSMALYVLLRKKHSTVSCGCYRDRIAGDRNRGKNFSGRSDRDQALYNTIGAIRSDAKARGLEWGLTDEKTSEMLMSACAYAALGGCGKRQNPRGAKNSGARNMVVIRNGIDRVDSGRGYTPDNCVPCCHNHNALKRDWTSARMHAFASVLEKIEAAARNNELSKYLMPDLSLGVVSVSAFISGAESESSAPAAGEMSSTCDGIAPTYVNRESK